MRSTSSAAPLAPCVYRNNSALEHQLKLAILRYDNGYSDYLTVLDSERNLFNGRLELISATRDQLLAQVSLFKALGGGATVATMQAVRASREQAGAERERL